MAMEKVIGVKSDADKLCFELSQSDANMWCFVFLSFFPSCPTLLYEIYQLHHSPIPGRNNHKS
jgi:hypothetical protein